MNPKDYIPSTADPSVPIPPGLVHSTLENSIFTAHPIVADEITTDNFSDNDAGLAQFHAYARIRELLSHGFVSDNSNITNDDWIILVANLLADIVNSIRKSHSDLPTKEFTHIFYDIEDSTLPNIDTIKHAASSLSSFFTTRFADPSNTTMCMRCLEECNIPVTHRSEERRVGKEC